MHANTQEKWLTQNKRERWPAGWVGEKHSDPHERINKNSISEQQQPDVIPT